MYRSSETSDLFEELIADFGLNDSISTEIDDRYHDSKGDIVYFEQLLNEDTSSDVSPSLLPIKSSSLDLPLLDPKQICLSEVERFDPFFSLTQSGEETRVMEIPSFGFYHMPSPCPAAYSPKEVKEELGEQLVNFLMENVDVAGLPRHLVKRSFNHLLKITNPTKKLSDPLGDDSKPRSYDVTFSNLLFDFNDDYTLCYDNPLFDEEFEEINEKIDLLLRDDLVTLLTRDREIDFNPCRDIEELECLLANDHVPIPRVFDEPLGNSDSMSRPIETSDLILEELTTEIGLDDSISTDIDDRYYDSEESSSLVPPLLDPKQIFLREVERFDPFFSLTQSGKKTRVMETHSFSSRHKPSPRPDAYSLKVVMYCYYHPHLTSSDGFDPKTNSKIPYDLEDLHACF
ncbi:hypothetical protein Tco_0595967 [Tanacetum coccineum]